MVGQQLIPLNDKLRAASACWCEATGRSLGALSSIVTNQGSFFDRLGNSRNGTNTTTLEKFARFLTDPTNWPTAEEGGDGRLPEAVLAFGHAVGVIACEASASPDTDPEIIDSPAPVASSTPSDRGADPQPGAGATSPRLSKPAPGELFEQEARL